MMARQRRRGQHVIVAMSHTYVTATLVLIVNIVITPRVVSMSV